MLLLHSLHVRGPVHTAGVVEVLQIHASLFQFHSCCQQASQPAALPATVT